MTSWGRLLGCLIITLGLAGCELLPDDEPGEKPDKDKKVEQPIKDKKDGDKADKAPVKDTKDGDKADKSKPAEDKSVESHGSTYKVEKGPFKVEVNLKGIFESKDMTEVAIHTEAWAPNPLIVKRAVEHGTHVYKGDTLIELDLEKIDDAIYQLKSSIEMGAIALKQAEEEMPLVERGLALEMTDAERSKKLADEDLQKFLDIDKPTSEKTANFMVKANGNYLEYAKEELRQLEKMYRDKDIREDTEEIILKRQRNQVEEIGFMLKLTELRRDQTLKVTLPRTEYHVKEAAVKAGIALEKAKIGVPLTLSQKRLALKRMRYDADKSKERLAKLERDRETMTVKAPTEGIVYYGKCVRGQWSAGGFMGGPRLHRGGIVPPEEVVMTVVKTRPIFVRVSIDEKDLQYLRTGLKAKVVPTTAPDQKLPAVLESVSAIPVSAGTFDGKIALEAGKDIDTLVPGMACAVKLVAYQQKDALAVPSKAVFSDDLDEDQRYVYVVKKGAKPEKRSVTVGKTAGDKTEIISGLQDGDEILEEKPDAKKKVSSFSLDKSLLEKLNK